MGVRGRFAWSPKIAIPWFAIVHTAIRSLRDTAFRWTRCKNTCMIIRGPPPGLTTGSFVKNLAGTNTVQICAPHATSGPIDTTFGTRTVMRLASQIHATSATRPPALPFLVRPALLQTTVLVARLVSRAYASFRQHRAGWLVSSFVRVSLKRNMSHRVQKESVASSKVPWSLWSWGRH